ncbi:MULTISPECIES: hypothetical protein [unclassified Nocardioides]|uniref:hypothetical protein n=1 Tax=unclassified Nocardioides TaxID=2615069 RepID=UPI0030148636
MTGLTAAHRGYEYQDLMTACRLVDVVLGVAHTVLVDEKLYTGDRFDDLTSTSGAERERTQFKHTDSDARPLTLATFTSDQRDLRLDLLVAAASKDRKIAGAAAAATEYRIVLRDARPVDGALLAVLRRATPDPGPFQSGMATLRYRFDADLLWGREGADRAPFDFLRGGDRAVSRADLDWFCDRAIVEVEAPRASWDLTSPGPAEALLLDRMRIEIGAGSYPNQGRSAVDVAEAFIRLARTTRQGTTVVSREDILRRAQLRQDYGAVTRARPADPTVAIDRRRSVDAVVGAAVAAADGSSGGTVVVTAPPGHGKSWLCDQVVARLGDDGWLVAEHYCYLGDADDEREARVVAESMFGSLLAHVADADPEAVRQQRPLLAAGEDALVAAVAAAIDHEPSRPVAIIVDGLDHVTRVRNDRVGFDASLEIARALAELLLPRGSALIVLSQPGGHLVPLLEDAAPPVEVPGLTRSELKALAGRLGMRVRVDRNGTDGSDRVQRDEAKEVLDALVDRSGGNALYATYLCRETLRDPAHVENPATAILGLPSFDGTLLNYYQHLWSSLEPRTWWVAEVIGVIDFAVTREELREINPLSGHRVNAALDALAPVIVERSGEGRLRIYHESFGRFLRQRMQDDAEALDAVLGSVAIWLQGRGLFQETRAFRHLLPLLARAGRHQEAVALVDDDFVVNAVAAAFPASAIKSCLATAATSAVRCGDWASAVRCVELGRAAETLQEERFESTVVPFADVVVDLVGADAVSDRLLHDGRTVMAGRAGLQMCAAVDRLGAVPPWREYMGAYLLESETDNTSYGADSDRAVDLAWLRGRLRLSFAASAPRPQISASGHPAPVGQDDLDGPIRWEAVAEGYEDQQLAPGKLLRLISDIYGTSEAESFMDLLDRPGPYCLAMAEAVAAGRVTGSSCTARTWAWASVGHGLPDGVLARVIDLGLAADDLDVAALHNRQELLDLTREVQQRSVRWEDAVLPTWLDRLTSAARVDLGGLNVVEALIVGPGWYRCWLRFCVSLARARNVDAAERDDAVTSALDLLTVDVRPFAGDPRACDLYPIHGLVQATVRDAVRLISDDDVWERAVGLIRRVGADISTTLSGELGGPLPSDWVINMTIRTAPTSKGAYVRSLVRARTAETEATFYSDIAETRLVAARIELAAGERDAAGGTWTQACRLLAAYGWRKDVTVYELLDPFPALIDADPRRARARLPALQEICEHVIMHTDGKGTSGAPGRWWDLLAAADPSGLVSLVAPALHASCNDPDDVLQEGLTEVWRRWAAHADPIVAGALRLTISPALDSADPGSMAKIAQAASTDPGARRILASCLARLDERPPRYSYTNSDDLVTSDNLAVAAVNDAVGAARAIVNPMPAVTTPAKGGAGSGTRATTQGRGQAENLASMILPAFPDGPIGMARAVRAWQTRPYSEASEAWVIDRATNVLGFRILEMAQDRRHDEAAVYLRQIADGNGLGRESDVLAALADGLELRGEPTLAAIAGTLAWTRARGRGGWLAFGGATHLESLRKATLADSDTVLMVVGDEVARAIRSDRSATWGITQALVLAFVEDALDQAGAGSYDIAFECFDAALGVVAARTPRIHNHDDPDLPYDPPSPDDGQTVPGDIDAVFAAATIAGLARPEREAKRRAMLATEYLLIERPNTAADGIGYALGHLSDPATLTWLLCLLTRHTTPGSPVLAPSRDALTALADGPQLTVRVLARSLLYPPPAPGAPEPADPELLGTPPGLWTPSGARVEARGDDGAALEIVNQVAGARLTAAEALLPGLGAAVVRRVAAAFDEEPLVRRMRRQLRALQADRGRTGTWPDAWLAINEATEAALQGVAAGVRSADLRQSRLREPASRESELAEALLDRPTLALELEATRQPRPPIVAPPSHLDPVWNEIFAAIPAPEAGDAQTAAEAHGLRGTTNTRLITRFDELDDFGDGWRILGCAEVLRSSEGRSADDGEVLVVRYSGLEVREAGERAGLDYPPFASAGLGHWHRDWSMMAATPGAAAPLVGLDMHVGADSDSREGLGVPERVATPSAVLLTALKAAVDHGGRFALHDGAGAIAALRTWRSLYETSDYHQPWPRLTGTALVIRERGFALLAAAMPRLVLRDFISRGDL